MSRVLIFWVEGRPVAKQRARTVRTKSGKHHTFTPDRTTRWETLVRLKAQAACSSVRWKPTLASYAIDIKVHRARRAGDADNFAKSCLDACNGVVWPDDRCVTRMSVELVDGQGQGMQVRVTRLEAAA